MNHAAQSATAMRWAPSQRGGYCRRIVGGNSGAIADSYATGAVRRRLAPSPAVCGRQLWRRHDRRELLGHRRRAGKSAGIGSDDNNHTGNVTRPDDGAIAGALPPCFDHDGVGHGAGTLSLFPLAISERHAAGRLGIAYGDNGVTPLNAGTVSALVDGTNEGAVSTAPTAITTCSSHRARFRIPARRSSLTKRPAATARAPTHLLMPRVQWEPFRLRYLGQYADRADYNHHLFAGQRHVAADAGCVAHRAGVGGSARAMPSGAT